MFIGIIHGFIRVSMYGLKSLAFSPIFFSTFSVESTVQSLKFITLCMGSIGICQYYKSESYYNWTILQMYFLGKCPFYGHFPIILS